MNEIKIKTSLFKEAITKAYKGSGRIDSLMLTSIMGIEVKNGSIILTTTDNTNFLTVKINDVVEDKNATLYISLDSELITKLVSKTDSDYIVLKVENDSLTFVGNGAYNIPLIIDPEEGTFVRIPQIIFNKDASHKLKINVEDIKKIIQYNKSSVSKDLKNGVYVNYCIDNSKVYTYNESTACITKTGITSEKMLLSQSLVGLLSIVDEKEINVTIDNNKVSFETETISVAGTLAEGSSEYASESFDELMETKNTKEYVRINKASLLSTLDRISLFIGISDEGSVEFTISPEGLFVKNKSGSVCEKIAYLGKELSESCVLLVDVNDIKNVLSSLTQEDLVINYNINVGLYIEENGALQIVPRIQDSSNSEVEEVEETYENEEDSEEVTLPFDEE